MTEILTSSTSPSKSPILQGLTPNNLGNLDIIFVAKTQLAS